MARFVCWHENACAQFYRRIGIIIEWVDDRRSTSEIVILLEEINVDSKRVRFRFEMLEKVGSRGSACTSSDDSDSWAGQVTPVRRRGEDMLSIMGMRDAGVREARGQRCRPGEMHICRISRTSKAVLVTSALIHRFSRNLQDSNGVLLPRLKYMRGMLLRTRCLTSSLLCQNFQNSARYDPRSVYRKASCTPVSARFGRLVAQLSLRSLPRRRGTAGRAKTIISHQISRGVQSGSLKEANLAT